MIWERVTEIIRKLKSRKIIDKVIRYIINAVLMLQIDYLITDWMPETMFIEKIDRKIRGRFRFKCVLSKVFPLSAV